MCEKRGGDIGYPYKHGLISVNWPDMYGMERERKEPKVYSIIATTTAAIGYRPSLEEKIVYVI
jgi:hypothetical protein